LRLKQDQIITGKKMAKSPHFLRRSHIKNHVAKKGDAGARERKKEYFLAGHLNFLYIKYSSSRRAFSAVAIKNLSFFIKPRNRTSQILFAKWPSQALHF